MASADLNFDTLPAKTGQVENQYWSETVSPNIESQQRNEEIEEIKNGLLRERSTSAFAELFEDLHRYIQQEQNSFAANEAELPQDITPVFQNDTYQYCSPVQNITQFPYNIRVQAANQIPPNHRNVVHHAHISFIPTAKGTLKTITKRKRKRTIFTTEQVEELEKYFSTKPYVTREDRQGLAERLKINDKAVKIWFQNRRLKGKRDQCQSPSSDIMNEHNTESHLDYVESQINEKTDQFGYVTLDDAMMGNLVNIIDRCLGNNTTAVTAEEPSNTCSSPIYEPISPPDSTKEEENLLWQSQAPTETLQTLLHFPNIGY